MIDYGSVCSGIESASEAWEPLGMSPAWFSEIEKFPSGVLAHRWPNVANLGDMCNLAGMIDSGLVSAPAVLVGGTPCQAFSVAGLGASLDDDRGQLTIEYVRIANAIDRQRPGDECVTMWENVPGILSTKDNAFGCFLGALAGSGRTLEPSTRPDEGRSSKRWRWNKTTKQHVARWSNAGVVYGPERTIAWRVLDAQYFGLAQRRKRVFVVASARDGFDPRQVLFEPEGLRRDTPPSREALEEIAGGFGDRPQATGEGPLSDRTMSVTASYGRGGADLATKPLVLGSHWDSVTNPHPTLIQSNNDGGIGASNQEVFSQRGSGLTWPADIAPTLNAHYGEKQGLENQHIDRGAPLFVPVPHVDVLPTMVAGGDTPGSHGSVSGRLSEEYIVPVTAFSCKDNGRDATDNLAPTLRAMGGARPNAGGQMAVAVGGGISHTLKAEGFDASEDGTGRGVPIVTSIQQNASGEVRESDVSYTVSTNSNPSGRNTAMVYDPLSNYHYYVRRLTPVECERLQGFPDNHTRIPWRGKASEDCPDGPRYKAIGNSKAVPVIRWLGARLIMEYYR